jgi:non-heme chloroperoxidase
MRQVLRVAACLLVVCAAALPLNGALPRQEAVVRTQFVTVQPDVKLEVLDWGGTGKCLVLLAGGGNTAHVFDSFARELAGHYHVIGITRRGFGLSSAPRSGYDPKRLGDDVVAVLDALHITNPVLVGHSIAGEELSAVSKYHAGRVAGLVYLDAGGSFALYNPEHGDYTPALAKLKDDLSALQNNLYDDAVISETSTDLALFQANLAEVRHEVEGAKPPSPQPGDLTSISAFQSYMKGFYGGIIPEAEVRQLYRIDGSGRVGAWIGHAFANQSVMLEEERFERIDTPLLAIFSYPSAPYPTQTDSPAKLTAYRAAEKSRKEAQIKIFREQPHAKVVVIPNATHYIFLSHPAEVISEIRHFVDGLRGD